MAAGLRSASAKAYAEIKKIEQIKIVRTKLNFFMETPYSIFVFYF